MPNQSCSTGDFVELLKITPPLCCTKCNQTSCFCHAFGDLVVNLEVGWIMNLNLPQVPQAHEWESLLCNRNIIRGVTQKHWPPVHGPPYGPGPRTTVWTGPQTPPMDPPLWTPQKKTIIKIIITIRDLTCHLFCFVFCFCFLLHCGDERRTCVLLKRPIT